MWRFHALVNSNLRNVCVEVIEHFRQKQLASGFVDLLAVFAHPQVNDVFASEDTTGRMGLVVNDVAVVRMKDLAKAFGKCQ